MCMLAAGVNTLQYSNGFVSFMANSDTVIPHTHNAAQCAQHCARSPDCVAWTRVAGEAFCPFLLGRRACSNLYDPSS